MLKEHEAWWRVSPENNEARLLLADILLGSGNLDLAKREYEQLLPSLPANQKSRVEQALHQCEVDGEYFPAAFREKLNSGVYSDGFAAAVWKDYARRDVQRGREVAWRL